MTDERAGAGTGRRHPAAECALWQREPTASAHPEAITAAQARGCALASSLRGRAATLLHTLQRCDTLPPTPRTSLPQRPPRGAHPIRRRRSRRRTTGTRVMATRPRGLRASGSDHAGPPARRARRRTGGVPAALGGFAARPTDLRLNHPVARPPAGGGTGPGR